MWRLFLIGTKAPVVVVQVALVYSDFFLICPEPPRMHLTPLLPRLRIVATIAALLILTACAGTRPMPYSSEKPTVKSEDGPVLLMTLTMKNKFAPKHHPLNVAAPLPVKTGRLPLARLCRYYPVVSADRSVLFAPAYRLHGSD